jgi:hypothetical protein
VAASWISGCGGDVDSTAVHEGVPDGAAPTDASGVPDVSRPLDAAPDVDARAPKPPPLWTADSVRIAVDEISFWQALRYEQTLDRLTPDLLDALEALDYEFADESTCAGPDGGQIVITVNDSDGTVRSGSSLGDYECGPRWAIPDGTRFLYLLDQLACLQWLSGGAYPALPSTPDTGYPIAAGDGCLHAAGGEGWFALTVATAGSYHVELGDCGSGAQLEVYDHTVDGGRSGSDAGLDGGIGADLALLAGVTGADAGACPDLVVDLVPGVYPIHVEGMDTWRDRFTYLRVF